MVFCPCAGSAEIRLQTDKSGWCVSCNVPFTEESTATMTHRGSGADPETQIRQSTPAVPDDIQSPTPETPAPIIPQDVHGGQDQVVYGIPVEVPISSPWAEPESVTKEEDAWAEAQHVETARVIICVGSVISVIGILLKSLSGEVYFPHFSLEYTCGIALMLIVFAALAFGAGFFIRDNVHRASTVALVTGAVVAVSMVILLGGAIDVNYPDVPIWLVIWSIFGAVGGGMMFAGGLMVQAEE